MEQTPDEQDAARHRMQELHRPVDGHDPSPTTATPPPADAGRLVRELQLELKRQQEALRTAQAERDALREQYADLYDFGPVGYCTLDAQGLLRQLSLRAAQLLGLSGSTAPGPPFAQCVAPEGRASFHAFLQRVLATDERQSCELELRRPDGSACYVLLEGLRLPPEAGEPRCRLALTDDTARRQAAESQVVSEQKFRALFEDSADAAVLVRDEVFLDCNPAALAMLGATRREQLVGQSVLLLTPEFQPDGVPSAQGLRQHVATARHEGSFRFEWLRHRFTGEEIWQEIVLTPVRVQGEGLLHAVWRDITARRRAARQLQESETRLSTALDAAELGVAQWNFTTDEVFFDARARQMFGLPAEGPPLTFPDIRQVLHPDDRERVEAALQRAIEEHQPVEMDQRVVWPDGTVRYVVSSGQVGYDAAGQALHMTGVVQDVTDKKLAAQRLQESEMRLKTAVRAADMGIGIWNFTSQLFYVDERARRMFGLPPEGPELTFAELMAMVHPADAELAASSLQRAASGEAPLDVEVRVVWPDGTVRYVYANGQVMVGEAGAPVRMSGVLRDVTESRLAEQRLRESEEQLRTALNAANMGVGLWEPHREEVVLDARTAEIFGFAAGAGRFPAAALSQLVHPDDLPGVVGQVERGLRSHQAFSLHVRVQPPAPTPLRYVRISGQALYDDHGQPSRVVGVVRDITEFRRANLRLRESEQRLRLALEASQTGVFEWLFESDELFWDARTQAIFGRSYDERRQSFDVIRRAVHPADADAVTAALTTTIRDGVPFELEHRIVRPDGAVRHVATSGQVHYDEAGQPQRLAGLLRDVTERRQAQDELNAKNRLLDHILTAIPVVLSRVAADGTLEQVTGAGLRRLGVADNALVGRNVFEDWPQLTPYIKRLMAGEPVEFVGAPPRRGDEQLYFQNYGFFDEERQTGVLFGLDVTETHQANARLAADAAFLQGLVSNIQEGIMAFDTELRVTEWNYLMEEYLQAERSTVLNQPIFEAFPAVDTPRNRDILRRTLAGETQTYYNVPFSRREGFFDAAFVPLRDAQGAVAGALGVVRNVTERNRLMEDATQARLQREKEVLSAIMHTQEDERKRIAEALHNGVGQLLYAAKLHLYNQPVDEAHRTAAQGLLNEAIKATRTISFELTPNILEDFGLKTALEEICKRIPQQNLAVHLNVSVMPHPLPRLLETAVYRIVQELLNNVIKHAQAREAFIYVEVQNQVLHASVEDDGTGFDVEASTRKHGGIGLTGIRNRVSLLGGRLDIRSKPGLGTTITIELPLAAPEPQAAD
ncbi:sensor histidine kinase [Hymenobacter jeollabukensis]|uniref:histidine kinase n=1 Tax=Hymenobacter jeollabukensis TaxID=2025313 RepID=A0A5R8WMG1_9BACT|nr:PAS domain S-box protein [Hymenobacter jeollabukensis]TLM90547.1 PAS domain S-box protein [Hymenobacter jeollabukensis]